MASEEVAVQYRSLMETINDIRDTPSCCAMPTDRGFSSYRYHQAGSKVCSFDLWSRDSPTKFLTSRKIYFGYPVTSNGYARCPVPLKKLIPRLSWLGRFRPESDDKEFSESSHWNDRPASGFNYYHPGCKKRAV
ncbi:unnamed protein product [Adineta ricciae]|uniref:Uncharacterized protein n=1 Tax=Adineta ricciae TaxID=249248 RepID=A0A815WM20_ADIRI|nr:unnamed protein product [Adineta ricciae]